MGRKKKYSEKFYKESEDQYGLSRAEIRRHLRISAAMESGVFSSEIEEKFKDNKIGLAELDNIRSGSKFTHDIHFKVTDYLWDRIMKLKEEMYEISGKNRTLSDVMRGIIMSATTSDAELYKMVIEMRKDGIEIKL